MKTTGKFSVSSALYLLVTLFWYVQLIFGLFYVSAAIWLVTTHTSEEIICVLQSDNTIREIRGLIYYSLVWFKSNPWLSMLISTFGHLFGWLAGLWATYNLRTLVKNIQSDLIYSMENIVHARAIALGLFAVIVIDGVFKKNFEWFNLFLALFALVFVEILRQGRVLAEDQKYTI